MVASYLAALRGYSRDVRTILIVSAISSFTMDGVFPVVFNLYILRMGYNAEFVGTVNAFGLLAFSIAALPAGPMGARLGARKTMVIGVVMTLVSAWAIAFTDLLPQSWIPIWIVTAFSVLYAGIAFYWVNCSPALINLSANSEQARVISVQSAMGNFLAFVGGPLAGLLPIAAVAIFGWSLTMPGPYRLPLMLVGIAYIVALFLILRLKEVPTDAHMVEGGMPGAPPAAIGFLTVLIVTSIFRFLIVSGVGTVNTFFNVYMDEAIQASPATIGIVIAVARFAAIFVALLVPVVVTRFGTARTAIVAVFGTVLVIIPMGLLPYLAVASVGYLGVQTLTSLRYNAMFVYLMSITPPHLRTVMTGAGEFSGGLAFAFFAWIGGYIIVSYGYTMLFVGTALITLVGGFVFWGFVRWWDTRSRALAPAAIAEVVS